jgi:hypothetical protein
MPFGMIDALVAAHVDELQRQAGRQVRARRPGARRAASWDRWPRLRRYVGFTLVEAGLRLLATAGSTSAD